MKVYTRWIAEELKKRGFKYETEQNLKLPRYKVFLFKDTQQFEKAFLEITRVRKKK